MTETQIKTNLNLGVNIDHVATLRQVRGTLYPDPVHAALLAELGGADSITVHLREDRRHIQDRDVHLLKETLNIRLNLEMACTDEMLAICEKIKPTYCCLVPEKRHELTTEGGLDVVSQLPRLREASERLQHAGIMVSLFIDPAFEQIEAAQACGVDAVELHTGVYADAYLKSVAAQNQEWQVLSAAARFAKQCALHVNAGHGLSYHNVRPIVRIPEIVELNIGHSIVARAMFEGMTAAVRHMKELLN